MNALDDLFLFISILPFDIDYANDRLTTCIFYTVEEGVTLASGIYSFEILEEDVVIGTTQLELR